MCMQIDFVFSCGHRSFAKFDNCINFGSTCYGASGNHLDQPVAEICRECQLRKSQSNGAHQRDPFQVRTKGKGKA
ncbi:hypothetical protein QBC39DRAFT_266531 [Podospora conica]|nr:hypothetical protein QBC39DRAFT_266531 [Schizothecium conicum]